MINQHGLQNTNSGHQLSDYKLVVLLPHYDDEVFVVFPLLQIPKYKEQILFVFIIQDKSEVRKKESLRFLQSYGFSIKQVLFLDQLISVPDGAVIQYLQTIESYLKKYLNPFQLDYFIAPAWEGGHQDHDACYVLSNKLALDFSCQSAHYCTYTGYKSKGKFFNIIKPIPNQNQEISYSNLTVEPISMLQILGLIWRIRFFPSQFKTWIGILPMLIIRLFTYRKIPMLMGDLKISQKPPHDGLLLYERYSRMTYEQFKKHLEAI